MRGKNIIRYDTHAASVFLEFVVYLLVVAISAYPSCNRSQRP